MTDLKEKNMVDTTMTQNKNSLTLVRLFLCVHKSKIIYSDMVADVAGRCR